MSYDSIKGDEQMFLESNYDQRNVFFSIFTLKAASSDIGNLKKIFKIYSHIRLYALKI